MGILSKVAKPLPFPRRVVSVSMVEITKGVSVLTFIDLERPTRRLKGEVDSGLWTVCDRRTPEDVDVVVLDEGVREWWVYEVNVEVEEDFSALWRLVRVNPLE